MKKISKCLAITLAVAIVLSALSTNTSLAAEPIQYATSDITKNFLSNVLGLDLTKYSFETSPYETQQNTTQSQVAINAPIANMTETFGVKVQAPSYHFQCPSGTLDVFCIFNNGQLNLLTITPYNQSSYVYAETFEKDLVNYSTHILEKYSDFLLQKAASDISFIAPMINILNNLDAKSPANLTVGNINFQFSSKGNETRLQWFYTESDIVMNAKRVEIDFHNNNVASFQDTWSLFKISGLSAISADQAEKIALDRAQNVKLHLQTPEGNKTLPVPDLSTARCDKEFHMMTCTNYVNDPTNKLSLDPLTLYPLWQFRFYFNQTIAGNEGVQVGVLGDTSKVLYAGTFGYLGVPTITTISADPSNRVDSSGLWIIIAFIATLVLIVSIPIAFRRKIRQRK